MPAAVSQHPHEVVWIKIYVSYILLAAGIQRAV
jgi:hypothetical protein